MTIHCSICNDLRCTDFLVQVLYHNVDSLNFFYSASHLVVCATDTGEVPPEAVFDCVGPGTD